jgi:23S rRNA (cytosine1962-C5)-methyltransferase
MHEVIVKRGRAKPFWCGNPLVFSGALVPETKDLPPGTLVDVRDADGARVGSGVYNPLSQYRVRLLAQSFEGLEFTTPADIARQRIGAAAALRASLGLPSDETNAFRLLNSEGDRCSGLTIDCYNDVAVVASSAYWVEQWRREITEAVGSLDGIARVCWQQVPGPLNLDGWHEFDASSHAETVEVREHGLRYRVDACGGQKTGFYCDQRDNRLMIRRLARGRRVLDLYCYTGGFAINAAIGGASEVLAVDSSPAAVERAQVNAALNGVDPVVCEHADAPGMLRKCSGYDLIIVDPPKLATNKAHARKALNHYNGLVHLALDALAPGGMLLLCSCSAALTTDDLRTVVREVSLEAQRLTTILAEPHAGPDHPIHPAFPEGEYLNCVLVASA